VTLDGQQLLLGPDKRAAHEEFNRLMVMRGRGVSTGRVTVEILANLWLADCERRLAVPTVVHYRFEIRSFAAMFGQLQARDLRPFHITQWISAHPNWSQSTQHTAISAVKICMGWAKRQGYLDTNPVVDARKPGITRRAPITMAQAEAVIAAAHGMLVPALRLLLVTGLRPGELCSLDARQIDLVGRRANVVGRTGKRTIPIGDAAAEILGPLVRDQPNGPIFIGQRGPLRSDGLNAAMKRAIRKADPDGLLDHVTPGTFRGLFATEALRRGVDSALVSRLLGHRDATILLKHYASPDDSMLRDAMERATAVPIAGTIPDKSLGRPR
jgi:integrase